MDIERGNKQQVAALLIDGGGATVGALVGLAIGGPPGALIGAASGPIATRAGNALANLMRRRQRKAAEALAIAMVSTNTSEEDLCSLLETDEARSDQLIDLIRSAAIADDHLAHAFSQLLGALLTSSTGIERERIGIISDALAGLRGTHIRILQSLLKNNERRHARDIATDLGIPEHELRSVVRSLEARGMIKDLGHHPIEWQLRELGKAVAAYVNQQTN